MPDPLDAEPAQPCCIALMVATLSLMSAHAAPDPGARVPGPELRRLVARKVANNLFRLSRHPHAGAGLSQVAAQLHAIWLSLSIDSCPRACSAEAPAWTH